MSEFDVSKPFARWENFGACVLDQRKLGHGEESAKKICGAIKERAEKGMLYKTADLGSLEVLKGTGNDLIVGGPASWDVVDPANDWVTVKAHQSFLTKFFKLNPKYRNVSIDHSSLIIGEPLLQYPDENPRYFSHVHEKGMYLISKIRDDNMEYTKEYRQKILDKEYKMYSIRGKAINPQFIEKNGSKIRKIDDIDPIEVAIVKEGMCPMPKIEVLKEKINIKKIGESDGECYCVGGHIEKATVWVALCNDHFNSISEDTVDKNVEETIDVHNVPMETPEYYSVALRLYNKHFPKK